MIDKAKISRQLDELEKYLHELEEFKDLSKETYLQDKKNIYSLRYLLQVSIETCINIGNHILSRYKIGLPDEYADVFRLLSKESIINEELEKKLIQMVRFRNRLVHVYWDIDDETIFEYLQQNLTDFYDYKSMIKAFLSKK